MERIPPVEQRLGTNGPMTQGTTGALGALGGAAVGSAFGPAGTVVGGLAGAALTGNRRRGNS